METGRVWERNVDRILTGRLSCADGPEERSEMREMEATVAYEEN